MTKTGFFVTAMLLLISVVVFSEASSNVNEEPIRQLIERASIFGINIPEIFTKLPIIGGLIQGGTQLINNSSASVFSPIADLIGTLTGGYLSKNGLIFTMLDRMSGGLLSAISGTGGLKPPTFDTQDVINVAKNITNDVSNKATAIVNPLFDLAKIPGDVIGGAINKLLNIFQSIPFPTLVTPKPQG